MRVGQVRLFELIRSDKSMLGGRRSMQLSPQREWMGVFSMASGINIYLQLLISLIRIVDISNSNC